MAGAVVSGAQVSFISQDCEEIPEFLGRKYGHMAKRLDLSFNLLRVGYEEDGAKLLSDDQQKNKKQLSQLQQGNFQPPQGRLSGRGA